MLLRPWRALSLVSLCLVLLLMLATCTSTSPLAGSALYVQQITSSPQEFSGQDITVDGAYLWRPGDPTISVLALGVSTLDNGLDAEPLGEAIWVEGFPAEVTEHLHRPGDSVYGFVRVRGRFDSGGSFGPNGQFQHQLTITSAEPIERIRRVENRIEDQPLGEGKVSFFELQRNPEQYHEQTITTRGYYFWNSVIYVLAEGVSTEEDGAGPQPLGAPIWMEGFPPDQSANLNVGPNNSFVWGLVEVTGRFQTGGGFGRDGAYQSVFFVESAVALPQ
ncbi:hypothetical protein [Candidatus Chloroploca asiatica]|uniref:Bacterial spore germination immunoglobulin-like domain-containing protein n=1 Tax=Candidatus Chloroploca asiatica TaxID=1506545 RepID=A0A2H3KYB7_9CHLR|nr:hypothetical protein [Candidatus Chloroploca asiatica]PDV97351.1 hypothetical protein A9Q02_18765 [Candidatus Chloroploca asiatica]